MTKPKENLPPVVWVKIADIIVPPDRQRDNAKADQQLCQSIERIGLLNPIIIHSDKTLVAGERRLDAFHQLKRDKIPCRIFENLPPTARFEAELQENLARKQLTWQQEVLAIGRYHHLRLADFAGWTQMGTAEALGLSQALISRDLAIYDEREDAEVMGCPSITGAFNRIVAQAQRARIAAHSRGHIIADAASSVLPTHLPSDATKEERTAALLSNLTTANFAAETVEEIDKNLQAIAEGRLAKAHLEAEARFDLASDLVIAGDFLEWAESYDGPTFDVLHLDFPWGKNYSGARTRRTGKTHIAPVYADDPDIYFGLVAGLLALQDRLAYPAAHCICWFDHIYYQWTVDRFLEAGWDLVQPHPYIWTKGYQGIAADVNRRPRHCYEAALLFVRGGRPIVKLDKDHFDCRVDEKLHINQKPLAMLKHLLSIFVDEHTAVLDPTCGSGSAIAAAKQLGAQRVLGVEMDEDNAAVAKFLLQRVLGGQPLEEEVKNDDASTDTD